MKFAVVDCRISDSCKKALENFADKIILLPPFSVLDAPVASHPDMLIWACGRELVTYKDYYTVAKPELDTLKNSGFELIFVDELPDRIYPADVHLNCALVGRKVICRTSSASRAIKEIAKRQGLSLIDTRQGYAKCSLAVVSDNALITADRGIFKIAKENGIDALLISEGGVRLDGYGTGFIGGATGTADTFLLFCGSLDEHPDAEHIKSFCDDHGKQAVSLSAEPLTDLGTVFILENRFI